MFDQYLQGVRERSLLLMLINLLHMMMKLWKTVNGAYDYMSLMLFYFETLK